MNRLKQLRIDKGLTQMKLAKLVEVSLNTIIKWENDAGSPSDKNYIKLLAALGVDEV